MTIGIDASRANHTQKTGVEWYAFFVIQHLKKIIPADVQVILYSDKPLQGALFDLPPNWSSKILHWPPQRLWTQIRMSYEMLVHRPDVLFIPAHVFPIIHPKKTVMTVHDIAGIKFPQSYNWFERWYSVWSAKYAVQKLWQVVVPSQFTQNELLAFISKSSESNQKTGKNCTVVHNGYDENFLKKVSAQEKQNILQKYGITEPYLLSIGRLEEKKNTWRIIKAFDEIKKQHDSKFEIQNLKLVLIGQPGFGFQKVQEAIDQSPYSKDIIHPGWVGKEALPALMQGATVFVFPSLYEGFGIPVLEAFASETPVLVSTTSCLQEIGEDGVLAVDPLSNTAIANGIMQLLFDETLRNEKIKKGKARVADFSWEKCANEIAQILLQ